MTDSVNEEDGYTFEEWLEIQRVVPPHPNI
jgi:hypothetical protein